MGGLPRLVAVAFVWLVLVAPLEAEGSLAVGVVAAAPSM